ncbi:hypothetical protein DFLDMN_000717 [Cupriavidus sp. H19C3]|uniref:hypothetical protein n=1 Tax=Cupriavidus sp. H19C3 TaxID=3241603 RepID=UPI003BF91922
MRDSTAKLLLAASAIAAIVFVVKKNGGLQGAAAGAASALVGAVGDAASGAVLGIGDVLGIPRTDMTECERAIAEGRTWDASFACPAGTFLNSLVSGDRQPDYSIDSYTGTYAARPVTPWAVTENAGGAAFLYPRIRRAS